MSCIIPDAIKNAATNLTLKAPSSSSLGSVTQVAADGHHGLHGLREGSHVLQPDQVHKPSQQDPHLARFPTDPILLKFLKGSLPLTRSTHPVVRQTMIRDKDEFDVPNGVTMEDVSDCSDDCAVFDLDKTLLAPHAPVRPVGR